MRERAPRVAGSAAIAVALKTSQVQVTRWASTAPPRRALVSLYRDPLRVLGVHDVLVIDAAKLEAWRRRNLLGGRDEPRVYGWDAIAARVQLRQSAARAAASAERDPLPVVRLDGERVWAYESALDEWRDAHEYAYDVHRFLKAERARVAKLEAYREVDEA